MALELTEAKPQTEVRTHEPTGVKVTFRRLGYFERMKVMSYALGGIGGVVEALAQKGAGVVKWDGVTKRPKIGDKEGEPVHVPYSIAAYEVVAEQDKAFSGWFNDNLLEINGITLDLLEDDDDEASAEGNDDAPSASTTG